MVTWHIWNGVIFVKIFSLQKRFHINSKPLSLCVKSSVLVPSVTLLLFQVIFDPETNRDSVFRIQNFLCRKLFDSINCFIVLKPFISLLLNFTLWRISILGSLDFCFFYNHFPTRSHRLCLLYFYTYTVLLKSSSSENTSDISGWM